MTEFTLTETHLTLIRHLYVAEDRNFGGPAIEAKRPFGDSDVERSVCKILGWSGDPWEDDGIRGKVAEVLKGLTTALQIVLLFAGIGPVQLGTYRLADQYRRRSWELVRV